MGNASTKKSYGKSSRKPRNTRRTRRGGRKNTQIKLDGLKEWTTGGKRKTGGGHAPVGKHQPPMWRWKFGGGKRKTGKKTQRKNKRSSRKLRGGNCSQCAVLPSYP